MAMAMGIRSEVLPCYGVPYRHFGGLRLYLILCGVYRIDSLSISIATNFPLRISHSSPFHQSTPPTLPNSLNPIIKYTAMQQQLKQLIQKKDELQKRLAGLQAQLQSINSLKNYESGLVDSEGFPRADLNFGELSNYRNLKRQKCQLNNDHFALMKQIEQHLFALHQTYPEPSPPSQPQPQPPPPPPAAQKPQPPPPTLPAPKPHGIDYLTPFAKVVLVEPDSPAHSGGLHPGDLISEFAEVTVYSIGGIKEIPKHAKLGEPIRVVVLREVDEDMGGDNVFELKNQNKYRKIELTVTPAVWPGKGLLGCKIDPLH